MESVSNKKRIAKNTIMLYFRQLLILCVNLYSVRVVLSCLGTVDYGIYNVVAGVVTAFNFLTIAMSAATQRFFSACIGENNFEALRKTFCITLEIYILLLLVIVGIGETFGLWFVNNKLIIPSERLQAANFLFHFVILSFSANMLSAPFMALIISHENMRIYASVSVIESVLKLIIVFLLLLVTFDKLILYGALLACISIFVSLSYIIYCKKMYKECVFQFSFDKKIFSDVISFSGWCLFGTCAGIAKNQITNVLLNMFFGPAVNAARGIAYNVNNAVISFSSNFNMAVRPQIIKTYSANEKNTTFDLVFQSTKLSWLLLWICMLPLFLEMEFVLRLWLKDIPEMTVVFTRLILFEVLFDSISYPLQSLSQASGKMKLYQSVVGGTLLLNLPFAYIALRAGYSAYTVQIIAIIIAFVALVLRIIINSYLTGLSTILFITKSICPCIVVSLSSCLVPIIAHSFISIDFMRVFVVILTSILTTIFFGYLFALNKAEKAKAKNILLKITKGMTL